MVTSIELVDRLNVVVADCSSLALRERKEFALVDQSYRPSVGHSSSQVLAAARFPAHAGNHGAGDPCLVVKLLQAFDFGNRQFLDAAKFDDLDLAVLGGAAEVSSPEFRFPWPRHELRCRADAACCLPLSSFRASLKLNVAANNIEIQYASAFAATRDFVAS